MTSYVYDYRIRKLKHGYVNGYYININYKRRRYICKCCNTKFPENNSIVEKYAKITNLNKQLIVEEYKKQNSFKGIGINLGISSNTVVRDIDKHINYSPLKLPEAISFDEFKKSNLDDSKYAFTIYDPINKKVIDIVFDRKSSSLEDYFSKIPYDERKLVKYVIIDLWSPYKSIIKKYFNNAIIIADKFHYIRYVYWAFNDVRKRVMKEII